MIRNSKLRALLGVVLGACAGTSLCLSILPLTLFQAGIGDETVLAGLLVRFVPYVALIWAAGGWGVSRLGFPLGGGIVMGGAGLASGLFAVSAALHTAPKILLVGGVTGLIYGFLGGLLLGRVLRPNADDEEDGVVEEAHGG